MKLNAEIVLSLAAMLLMGSMAVAQIPVELFTGHKKATLDIMFFRYFKDKTGNQSKLLFFNRNRASVDYQMTPTSHLPQFGFTEAISYNDSRLKGFAPVLVGQILGNGIYAKAGFQFAYIKNNLLLFSWLVCETKNNPSIDYFFLGRFTPKLTEHIQLFSQLELINALPASNQLNSSFTQRIRLGIKHREFQLGLAGDFSEAGRTDWLTTNNLGVFLRYEY